MNAARVGAVMWLTALLTVLPSPRETAWAQLLLLLAPLVLVPIGLAIIFGSLPGWVRFLNLATALCLGAAHLTEPGTTAGLLSLPWFGITLGLAANGIARIRRHGFRNHDQLYFSAGLIFLSIGGAWAVADRFGWRPLDFEPVIVLLTAIHFHYAGFVLPVVAGQLLATAAERNTRLVLGVIAAPLLVAIGITATQLGFDPVLESVAGLVMAITGLYVGVLMLRATRRGERTEQTLLVIAGLSLIFGMVLAGLYAVRFYLPLDWLDIPWMRALHGTANALGFGLGGLAAWSLRTNPEMSEG